MNINSQEYWDNRFDTDWLDYGGDKQTAFFAELLCKMIPDTLVHEIRENEYTVCDMGCALGEGAAAFNRKFAVDVDGMDFSAEAIACAKENYPDINFWVGDLMKLDPSVKYDVIICSNVLEHFLNPWKVVKNIAKAADKYIILMVPYREKLHIEEHMYRFSEKEIPTEIAEFELCYVDTADGAEFENSFYPDQQILLIYKKNGNGILMLDQLSEGIAKSIDREKNRELNEAQEKWNKRFQEKEEAVQQMRQEVQNHEQNIQQLNLEVQSREQNIQQLSLEIQNHEQNIQQLNLEVQNREQNIQQLNLEVQNREQSMQQLSLEIQEREQDVQKLNAELDTHRLKISSLQNEVQTLGEEKKISLQTIERLHAELQEVQNTLAGKEAEITRLNEEGKNALSQIAAFQNEQVHYQTELIQAQQIITGAESALAHAKAVCLKINSKTSYKWICAIGRFVRQFLLGSFEEKKKFLGICKRCITREKSEFTRNDGYNMILNVANLLEMPQVSQGESFAAASTEDATETMESNGADKPEIIIQNNLADKTLRCLKEEYSKTDVIIFSVINYDFRYQRPQHFAARFAENGHRVFYINANYVNPDKVKKENDHLYTVDFFCEFCTAIYYVTEQKEYLNWFKEKMDDLIQEYAISDAIIILDYPNWVYGAEYLRRQYGFRMIVDYMDDFTGFLGTTTSVLKDNCIYMLQISDLIVASSQFLHDIAIKYNKNISVVRNGTEVDHFYKAISLEEHRRRPVIGYYGAVSHWFAWEKVCYVAEHMPDCDIVIIGDITEHREKLEKYSNIQLLGEKKYAELPRHLAYFDVCLIPFDTSTDLIKATNPVKFYEYLSAGKRVVATEIPELEPYRDEYVYMSNDDEKFLEYVQLCLSGKDSLKSREECISFAKENDWQKRYETFAAACVKAVPKASIIVLTYNNLKLNQVCIESILKKTAYLNYELVVLDNMSTDGTVEYLHELENIGDKRVKIIFNDKNSGFAGGNNIAIKKSTGDYIVLLNNDTVVTRGWLTNLIKHMQNDSACGMCGAVTNSIGNEAMIGVNYKNMLELDNFAYQYTRQHNTQIYDKMDRLAMFCVVIRRDIMEKHGMLDENYQVGMFEDDDYAKVVEQAGYHFYIAEDVFIHHVNNASFKKLKSEEYKRVFEKNKNYFEQKWSIKWKMPQYREGVTADINEGMMVEPQ